MNEIVIIGGGHAGAQLCGALCSTGDGARVHLVCDEPLLPYQRPPLSKGFQKDATGHLQWHRGEAWFVEHGITLHRDDAALRIDRGARRVTLASGRQLDYEWLVLATGARARQLPQLPSKVSNIHVLRTAADAERLRASWSTIRELTVLGGGFIGLEVAATARSLGKAVRVLESAPRLMMRSVSSDLSAHALDVHRKSGIDVQVGTTVGVFELAGDRLVSLQAGGRPLAIDNLLLAIGAVPELGLARAAGLDCENGVVVDSHMCTSDPSVLAIGDCTSFVEPTSGRQLRLESVQNANDQAKAAAATIVGDKRPYRAVPWFWSEQGTMRLQMVGLIPEDGDRHQRPGPTPDSFSVLHYAGDRLVCVESVNAPMDHLGGRKLIELDRSPTPAVACDTTKPLRALAQ